MKTLFALSALSLLATPFAAHADFVCKPASIDGAASPSSLIIDTDSVGATAVLFDPAPKANKTFLTGAAEVTESSFLRTVTVFHIASIQGEPASLILTKTMLGGFGRGCGRGGCNGNITPAYSAQFGFDDAEHELICVPTSSAGAQP